MPLYTFSSLPSVFAPRASYVTSPSSATTPASFASLSVSPMRSMPPRSQGQDPRMVTVGVLLPLIESKTKEAVAPPPLPSYMSSNKNRKKKKMGGKGGRRA
ncbi:hypothetical protein Fmac_005748 [Flemingia macrophylla]|uniref:Uncharacterized protein n=1 Tax=Flemingia macrophylla TaxID=520843 RepID=A0ABD1NA10_9FABA